MARPILGGSKPDAPGTSRFFRGERRSVQSVWPARDDGLDRRRQAPVLAGTSITLRYVTLRRGAEILRAIRSLEPPAELPERCRQSWQGVRSWPTRPARARVLISTPCVSTPFSGA